MAEEKLASQAAEAVTEESNDFAALLNKEFRPKSDRASEEISTAIETLAEHVLRDTNLVSDDAVTSIQAMIAQIALASRIS